MHRQTVLFEGVDASGLAGLWETNGTAAGTHELTGISGASSYELMPFGMAVLGGEVLFVGNTPAPPNDAHDPTGVQQLWVTNGTAAGTHELSINSFDPFMQPMDMTVFNGRVFFNGFGTGDPSLWVTDGTVAGTHAFPDDRGNWLGGVDPSDLTVFGNQLLFDGINGGDISGLWVTDGTVPAHELTPISGGLFGLQPSDMTVFNGEVLFSGVNASNHFGLWVTNATAAGTFELTGISGANANGILVNNPGFMVFNGEVLFDGVDASGVDGLWVTNGTAAGTHEVTGISGASSGGVFHNDVFSGFTVFNGELLFRGVDASGVDGLWVTNGTAAGTHEVTGISGASATGLNPLGLKVFNGEVLFEGTDVNGKQGLWETDGTAGGTHELVAGTFTNGLSPNDLTAVTLTVPPLEDFQGNNTSDILFRNASGTTYLWTMNNATVSSGATTSVQVGNNWKIKGVGDFDGNGTADLLWVYNNASNASDPLNGVSYVSFQNGANASGGGVVQQLSAVWEVAGAGDFNGDGMADVLYRNVSTGQTYLDVMNGSSVNWAVSGFTSAQVTDPHWQVAGVADFSGDGDADVLWRYSNAANTSDPLNGALYEWTMNGASVTSAGLLSQQAGKNWQVAGTGDFNGDGRADILFRYQNVSNAADALNGFTYIDFMNGTSVTSGAPTQWQIDNSWAIASIGDYNGDGMSDILFQQTSTGNTYVWQMNGASVTAGAFTSSQAGTGWTVQNGVLIG